MHGKVQSMDWKLTEGDAFAPSVDGRCYHRTKCCQKAAATQEVEGRGHHRTEVGKKGLPNYQKLQEGLVDTPEMDESAKISQK